MQVENLRPVTTSVHIYTSGSGQKAVNVSAAWARMTSVEFQRKSEAWRGNNTRARQEHDPYSARQVNEIWIKVHICTLAQ